MEAVRAEAFRGRIENLGSPRGSARTFIRGGGGTAETGPSAAMEMSEETMSLHIYSDAHYTHSDLRKLEP